MKRISITVEGLSHGELPIPTASRIGPFIATGGIRGVDRNSHELPADPALQAGNMFDNLAAVLEGAGAGCDRVLKLTIWIKDPALRPLVNAGWLKHFPDADSRPARHILTYDLPGKMLFQCEALAVCDF
jgi:enamine deaminase RidA (YjgF/YER057c/UK114 family)